jgi:hypothetical protein
MPPGFGRQVYVLPTKKGQRMRHGYRARPEIVSGMTQDNNHITV